MHNIILLVVGHFVSGMCGNIGKNNANWSLQLFQPPDTHFSFPTALPWPRPASLPTQVIAIFLNGLILTPPVFNPTSTPQRWSQFSKRQLFPVQKIMSHHSPIFFNNCIPITSKTKSKFFRMASRPSMICILLSLQAHLCWSSLPQQIPQFVRPKRLSTLTHVLCQPF